MLYSSVKFKVGDTVMVRHDAELDQLDYGDIQLVPGDIGIVKDEELGPSLLNYYLANDITVVAVVFARRENGIHCIMDTRYLAHAATRQDLSKWIIRSL